MKNIPVEEPTFTILQRPSKISEDLNHISLIYKKYLDMLNIKEAFTTQFLVYLEISVVLRQLRRSYLKV